MDRILDQLNKLNKFTLVSQIEYLAVSKARPFFNRFLDAYPVLSSKQNSDQKIFNNNSTRKPS